MRPPAFNTNFKSTRDIIEESKALLDKYQPKKPARNYSNEKLKLPKVVKCITCNETYSLPDRTWLLPVGWLMLFDKTEEHTVVTLYCRKECLHGTKF